MIHRADCAFSGVLCNGTKRGDEKNDWKGEKHETMQILFAFENQTRKGTRIRLNQGSRQAVRAAEPPRR